MNNAPPIILDKQDPCSPFSIPSNKTALLLLDFHKFIVASQPDGAPTVLEAAETLRSYAKSQGIIVVHCLIDLKAVTAANRKMAGRANGVRAKMGSAPDVSGEHPRLAAVADEYVFWRPPSHVSAMGSYGLEAFLAEHGIQSLLLAGFSTSGCVINTAKGAADKGFVVTAIKDACGDKSPEVQEVIMEKLLIGQAHVVGKDIFIEEHSKVSGNSEDRLEMTSD